jgi:hypothetical protein
MVTMMRIDRIQTPSLVLRFLLILLLLGAGCGSKEPEQAGKAGTAGGQKAAPAPAPVEMQFDVNPALLGMSYADSSLGLVFSPPRDWPPLEPDLFDATREAYSKMARAERFTSRPARIFSDGEKRFFMIVSEFPHWPVPLDPYVAFADYARQIQGPISTSDVQQTFYRHGNLDVYHLIISNPAMIDHRLMIMRENRIPIQVDYLMPRVAYQSFVKTIEASIGSFRAL